MKKNMRSTPIQKVIVEVKVIMMNMKMRVNQTKKTLNSKLTRLVQLKKRRIPISLRLMVYPD